VVTSGRAKSKPFVPRWSKASRVESRRTRASKAFSASSVPLAPAERWPVSDCYAGHAPTCSILGDDQAEQYLIGLFAGFQTLVDRPELRRPFREIPPYLRALVGKHAVFYRVTPDREVLIVRVLHAVMLPALHLLNEDEDDA
jgi:plasmid stabilization system protein ParE